ncbi:threonine synthase [Peptoniphilus equinus]|uniref:Threonine synthase n=1 Tax=Peptoniphilus equinus TaxID=3016343 RepID=A0ABY7QXC4_9FIRM|nr:threonine synthase [Peptoniphilus equinus]WBW50744.1 threonine synthase [Peptoniphilus equinus]
MRYFSTRGGDQAASTTEALLRGLARDGGLYVPEFIRPMTFLVDDLEHLNYADMAYKVISTIFDDLDEGELRAAINDAYAAFPGDVLPVKKLKDTYVMEQFHGPTRAFKDFALSLLPRLLAMALKEQGESKTALVLTATSGDTGSAAIHGFKNVPNTEIIVLYPKEGISEVQRAQMLIKGNNVHPLAIEGNFDDAQQALKHLFNDRDFNNYVGQHGYFVTSANSINIGRLVPQIAYYFYTYYTLVKQGEVTFNEPITFVVPTGNFGNLLAGHFAKLMGLPIQDLVLASNKNNVLTDFVRTGVYDGNRPFYTTVSPSMDILISSNLERYLYLMTENADEIKSLYQDLTNTGCFEYSGEMGNLYGWTCYEADTLEQIKTTYANDQYLVDPHTATAVFAAAKYREAHNYKTVVNATASPVKFAPTIFKALGKHCDNDAQALDKVMAMMNDRRFLDEGGDVEERVIAKASIQEVIEACIHED